MLIYLLLEKGQTAKLNKPQNSKYSYNIHHKLSVIKSDKVAKLFNSISDIGSELHSQMVCGKKLDVYICGGGS